MTEPLPVRIPAPEALPDPLSPSAAARAPAGTGTTTFVALSDDAALRNRALAQQARPQRSGKAGDLHHG